MAPSLVVAAHISDDNAEDTVVIAVVSAAASLDIAVISGEVSEAVSDNNEAVIAADDAVVAEDDDLRS